MSGIKPASQFRQSSLPTLGALKRPQLPGSATASKRSKEDPKDTASAWVKAQFTDGRCNHCRRPNSCGNVTRQQAHLLNPRVCPFLLRPAAQALSQRVPKVAKALAELSSATTPSQASSHPRILFGKGFDAVSHAEKKLIDSMVMRAVVENNIPFHVYESESMIDLFNQLRSGYKLPSRYEVSRLTASIVHAFVLFFLNALLNQISLSFAAFHPASSGSLCKGHGPRDRDAGLVPLRHHLFRRLVTDAGNPALAWVHCGLLRCIMLPGLCFYRR